MKKMLAFFYYYSIRLDDRKAFASFLTVFQNDFDLLDD